MSARYSKSEMARYLPAAALALMLGTAAAETVPTSAATSVSGKAVVLGSSGAEPEPGAHLQIHSRRYSADSFAAGHDAMYTSVLLFWPHGCACPKVCWGGK